MNHNFVKSTLKAMSILATAAVLVAGNPTGSYANNDHGTKPVSILNEQVSVQYIGTNDNSFVFHVEFENTSAQKFVLIVKNEAGTTVYQEQFTDAHFSKNFHLLREDGEIRPTFIIRAGNQQIERSFVVNTKLTENVVVTKL